ncbi:MAG: hypothetical protein AB1391_01590 [Candidatus Micrarchaeota archaeon]
MGLLDKMLDDLLGAEKKSYKEKISKVSSSSSTPDLNSNTAPNLQKIQTALPISMSIRFLPLRLAAKKDNRVDMIVTITNKTNEKQIVSFEALLPKTEMLGFNNTIIIKHAEKKGVLEPNARTEFAIPIYSTTQTKEGNYTINVSAYVHYLDYSKIINYIKRTISLRVV